MAKISGARQDLLVAKPTLPAVIALLYGAYKFFDLGVAPSHFLYTYVPTIGAIVSAVCVFMYVFTMTVETKRSVGQMLMALSGFVPYAFSLYLMGFLGVYSLWSLHSHFSIGTLLFGLFWIGMGYRMLYTFWQITELSVATEEQGD